VKDKNFRFYWEEPYNKKEPNVRIEVPGFKNDEIKVTLTNNMITVSASRKGQKIEKGKNFYREEAFSSSFSKSLSLPHKINAEEKKEKTYRRDRLTHVVHQSDLAFYSFFPIIIHEERRNRPHSL